MTSSVDVFRAADTEQKLRALVDKGFQFVHPRDAAGEVVAVVGIRVHDTVVDVIRLNAESDVVATRMPGTEADILAPATVLWQTTGTADHALDALLALADDDHAAADARDQHETGGCWVPVRPGTSAWMAART